MSTFDPQLKDLLPEKENEEPEYTVSRPLYLICLLAWILSLVSIPLCMIFNRMTSVCSLVSIAAGIILCAATGFGIFRRSKADNSRRGGFDSVVRAVGICAAVLFAASLLITVISGGSPEIVGGKYVIVSHNITIRTLNELEYKLLCINEGAFISLGACALFSSLLLYVRRHLPRSEKKGHDL